MIDKLREQQHEDLEEMECYVGQIKELAEKHHLETETMCLRSRLESSQHQTATLATLLERSGLEGIADASLGEQVAFLIADRAKLMEEIAVLSKLSGLNGVNKEADLISEIIKVSSEKEVLKHESAEHKERLFQLEKMKKQLELDNERLAFKLSEALAELEERESQLKEIVTDESRGSGIQTSMSMIWPRRESPSPPPGRRRQSAGDTLDGPRRNSPVRIGPGKKKGEPLRAFPKTWNADSPPEIKVSSNQELDDMLDNTGSLPRSFSMTDREMLRSQSYGADSTPPSLMLSEGASERMQVKLDAQIQASRTELARLEEIKKLQSDSDNLKAQLNGVVEKYNALVVRHVQHKARRKAQISDLKARLQLESGALEVQIQSLQSQLTNQKLVLRGEEGLRKKIENDYRKSLDEKRSLLVNMMSLENSIRDKTREISILQKKISMLESTNKDLMTRLLQVKYSHPCRSRSLTRVEGVLTDLGSV
ncbi:DNA double-strand break repair Rad50 ATPase, putative [Pediculus humanus corporis]|uniref:DNA double-strand break repair Rad50 ATPase, putative n=1 Tax=Pediculus humanus subsp. corporis TaxID=121224 RepID=E0VYN2_PEDHC|nr:DNA double-strand break repair Rad50 ATPase, putative [Pediculus humanus corporis]EEB18488.1 DNA double-strand break repair Rad50 ATPase, putative [Pediculus humanus corporis]